MSTMNPPENRKAWIVVALVFLFMLINYADKAVVGLSSVPIMRELGLSHAQFGILGSAFFLLFSVSGVVAAVLIDPQSDLVRFKCSQSTSHT